MLNSRWVMLASMILPLTACSDGGTEPEAATNDERAIAVTEVIAVFSTAGMTTPSHNGEFTFSCPAGGTRTLKRNGTGQMAGDTSSSTWNTTTTYTNCAIMRGADRYVMNGNTQSEGQGRFRLRSQNPPQIEIIALQARDRGSLVASFQGESYSCSYDFTTTLERATNMLHMRGTSCGGTIDITRPAP